MEAVTNLDPDLLSNSRIDVSKIDTTEVRRQLIRKARIEAAQRNYLDFCRYCIQKAPYYSVNWHHRVLAQYLQRWANPDSNLDRLMVFMPPQHGKTEMTSRQLPPWIFGHWPDARIIGGSYSATLAKENSRDAKRVINSDEYHDVFAHSQIPSKRVATDEREAYKNTATHWEIVGRRGSYKGVGAGQGVSGSPADYIIMDDPQSRTMAGSKKERDGVDEWWQQSLRTRLSNIDKALLVMTRWHQDDLAGRILDRAKSDDRIPNWEVLKIKGLKTDESAHEFDDREAGQALWPEHKTKEDLEAIRASSLTSVWMALYQQEPVPPGGSIVKRDWLESYGWGAEPSINPRTGDMYWSIDPKAGSTNKNSSEAVIQLWWAPGDEPDLYLIDEHKGIWDQPTTIERIRKLKDGQFGAAWTFPATKVIEDKGDGPAIIKHCRAPDKQSGLPAVTGWNPYDPDGTKEQRLSDVARYIKGGQVHIPRADQREFVESLIDQIADFPGSVRDDRVDALSQMLDFHFLRQSDTKNKTSPAYREDGSHYLEDFTP